MQLDKNTAYMVVSFDNFEEFKNLLIMGGKEEE
jgi:hypothetical protein